MSCASIPFFGSRCYERIFDVGFLTVSSEQQSITVAVNKRNDECEQDAKIEFAKEERNEAIQAISF